MKKKILTTALGLFLAAVLFTAGGCGNNSKDTEKDNKKTEATETDDKNTTDKKQDTPADNKGTSSTKEDVPSSEENKEKPDSDANTESNKEASGESSTTISPNLPETAPERRDLTADEISQFTDFVNSQENNGFLQSSYTTITGADLDQIFYNGAGLSNSSSDEIRQAYMDATGEEIMTDFICLSSDQIDTFLQQKTGHSLSEFGGLNWTYLSDYDVYCTEHGDTNYQSFTFSTGWYEDGIYYLNFQPGNCYLTLEESNGSYHFISNMRD